MADSEFYTVSIGMIPPDGPAVVVSLEGQVTLSDGELKVGALVPQGVNVRLAPASRIVLRLSDGSDAEYESEIDKERLLHFLPRTELERPPENLLEAQLKGFAGLRGNARTMGFDATTMMQMMAVTHSREQAFEVLDLEGATGLLPSELASRLQVVPLRKLDWAVLVAGPRWSPEKCIELLQLFQCGISPVQVSNEVFEELTKRVYG
jgi:hypothetical protein